MDIEDEKAPLEKMGIIIPEEFVGLFADPPLLEGEDPTAYRNLVVAMIKDRKPQGFLEWTYVCDMVNKLWEEGRFRRASTGLMRGEMFSALMYFLRQIHEDGQEPEQTEPTFSLELNPPRKLSAAEKLAFKYFSKDPKEKQQVTSLLARYGITPAVLQAKAAQQNSDAVQMFEAMGARRGRERRKLRREDERLRRRRDSLKGSNKE